MKDIGKIVLGVIIVLVGIIIGTNSFGLTNIDIFFPGWWTMFIIIPSLVSIIKEEDKMASLIWLVVGVALLLVCNDIISWEIIGKLALPVILVVIGMGMIFGNTVKNKVGEKIKEINQNNNEMEETCAVFSGDKIVVENPEYKGGKYSAVFAGLELDLTKCEIKEDCVIETSAIFGGIEIKVPDNVNIKIKPTSVFGGTKSKVKNINEEGRKTIYVNSTAMFGGVELK